MRDASYWIERLGLAPHPEGGFFAETYRSALTIPTSGLPPTYDAPRSLATAIYFLLDGDDFSAFHRLKGDEIWHHYLGSSLTIHVISGEGAIAHARLGSDPDAGQLPQVMIAAGSWFAVSVDDPAAFGLAGCTMAPGFTYADLELGSREVLLRDYPRHRGWIERFTRALKDR